MYENIITIIRSQPLHDGHIFLIQEGLKKAKKMDIVIGSANESKTEKNPLNAQQRKEALSIALKALLNGGINRIQNIYLLDNDPDDNVWADKLEELVGKNAVILTNNTDSWVQEVLGKRGHIIEGTPYAHREDWMGTNIRNLASQGNDKWRKFVPKEILPYYDSINFEQIVKDTENIV